MMEIAALMQLAPVIPVLVVDDPANAQPLAEALVAGGLPLLEVTLRTPAALEVIAEMTRVPGAIVGAGTVLNPADLAAAVAAGAQFIVSPGLTTPLAEAAIAARLPFLPGVANAADIMRGLDLGLSRFKFFPAVPSGGLPVLSALAAVFGAVRFCPTGGISAATAADWLAKPFVDCIGGSWLAARGETDWPAIAARARAASARATA
jgi:2-dehydro-3-deoxyphosphogluconate aldolase/(4S)-4-hydroxy-2-oxoglutarate aldolase